MYSERMIHELCICHFYSKSWNRFKQYDYITLHTSSNDVKCRKENDTTKLRSILYGKYAGHTLGEPFAIYLAMQENCVL